MDMREGKAATVTLEEIATLSRRMAERSLCINRMMHDGRRESQACRAMASQNAYDSAELAMALVKYLTETVLKVALMYSTEIPFVWAAFTVMTDRIGEMAESYPGYREVHDRAVQYIKMVTRAKTITVSAEAFETMRAQARGDEKDEKKETEEE